ncbi:MAG: hypothetical protein QW128_05805 [Thermoprotei archaeon]
MKRIHYKIPRTKFIKNKPFILGLIVAIIGLLLTIISTIPVTKTFQTIGTTNTTISQQIPPNYTSLNSTITLTTNNTKPLSVTLIIQYEKQENITQIILNNTETLILKGSPKILIINSTHTIKYNYLTLAYQKPWLILSLPGSILLLAGIIVTIKSYINIIIESAAESNVK